MTCTGTVLLELDGITPCIVKHKVNRFVVEAELQGYKDRMVKAHNTNTGRLLDIIYPGSFLYCVKRRNPGKTEYSIIGSKVYGGSLINTRLQEMAFIKAVELKLIPWLKDCILSRTQPVVGDSKFDLELDCRGEPLFLELKSAVLRGSRGEAMYPDCPTLRGRRHIQELSKLSGSGLRTAIVFIAAFPGAVYFTPYDEGDPEIRKLLLGAIKQGVMIKSIGICLDVDGTKGKVRIYNTDLPVIL
ncbi:MAG: DNA/RNA nuclease SfsA [Desulfurococcales archaeon]|nr:DNA/RNA nuclease SfsA [Desulfurococcales archaeon]